MDKVILFRYAGKTSKKILRRGVMSESIACGVVILWDNIAARWRIRYATDYPHKGLEKYK